MARYILKRKTYGIVDSAKETTGGVMKGVGTALDSTPAAIAGGAIGASTIGSALGAGLGSTALGALGGPVGMLAGALIGAKATRGLGKGLKHGGDSMAD